ncbi:amidase signature domain-containing protein [Trichoderma compactum]
MAPKPFNLLTSTAHDIQELFDRSELSAESLVTQVLDQVKKHNRKGLNLGALISVAPRQQLLERAQFLDQERASGKARSPFHGIPFIVKDAIATDPQLGMDTTAGSWALVGSRTPENASTVQKEFNNFKGQDLIDGWSPVNGYTRSAYVSKPTGLLYPQPPVLLYAMKPTIGTVSMDGIIPVSQSLDSVGVMARSPADLVTVIEMLQATMPNHDERLSQLMTQKWDGLRIGFVDEKIWKFPESLCKNDDEALFQMRKEYHSVMKVLSDAGVHVEYPVQLPPGDKVWPGIGDIIFRNLQELVDWNRQNADRELPQEYPSQSSLESALQCNISATENAETLAFLRKLAGPDGIDQILSLFNLDAIASLADSPLSSVASAAGYPITTMPLGILDMNGRPFGISMTASKHQEKNLFRPPPALMEEANQEQP